jgi:hypothetical protein
VRSRRTRAAVEQAVPLFAVAGAVDSSSGGVGDYEALVLPSSPGGEPLVSLPCLVLAQLGGRGAGREMVRRPAADFDGPRWAPPPCRRGQRAAG